MSTIKDSCPNKVEPFPFEFCADCALNGCWPWNTNPLLCCSYFGGISIEFIAKDTETDIPLECSNYKKVDESFWEAHINDLKRSAKWNVDLRNMATMNPETYTSEDLPEHIFGD